MKRSKTPLCEAPIPLNNVLAEQVAANKNFCMYGENCQNQCLTDEREKIRKFIFEEIKAESHQ